MNCGHHGQERQRTRLGRHFLAWPHSLLPPTSDSIRHGWLERRRASRLWLNCVLDRTRRSRVRSIHTTPRSFSSDKSCTDDFFHGQPAARSRRWRRPSRRSGFWKWRTVGLKFGGEKAAAHGLNCRKELSGLPFEGFTRMIENVATFVRVIGSHEGCGNHSRKTSGWAPRLFAKPGTP